MVGDSRTLEHETYSVGVMAFRADHLTDRLSSDIMLPVQPGLATFRRIAE